ncbi:MAG: YkgJ family cysteine cluster protein [Candidatus Methanosuratincola petrocarbonis]
MFYTQALIPEIGMFVAQRLPYHSCRRCGRCCTAKLIPLYEKDLERLSGFRGFYLPTNNLEREITGAKYKMKMVDSKCVFLEGTTCKVYDVRPDTCRRHPFIVTKRRILVSAACPGVDWSKENNDLDNYRRLSSGISEGLDRFIETSSKLSTRWTRP